MSKQLSLLLLGSLLFLASCHKYEDGPFFTLKSAKSRLSHDWILQSAFKNEADTITAETHFAVNFTKSETITYVDTVFGAGVPEQVTVRDGSWQLTNDDANIGIVLNDVNGAQQIKVWYILRLDDQLWVREQIGNDYFEYHFLHRP